MIFRRSQIKILSRSKEGIFLFSLVQKAVIAIPQNTVLASVLRILAALVIFLLVHIMATWVVYKNFYGGVLFLIGFILMLRITSYYLPIPLNLRQFELFNPNIYGSNSVLRSLGDLLINSLLFLWVILFVRHFIQEKNVRITAKGPAIKLLIYFIWNCYPVVMHISMRAYCSGDDCRFQNFF